MNHIFSALYGIATIASIVACLPQIIQVLKTKTVEGISLQTYDMWLIFQFMSMPHAYQSGDMVWFGAGVLWATYYAIMILLIEHYRYPHYMRLIVEKVVQALRLVPVPARTRG